MKVSLNGISNQCFFDRFFEKRIYCKSESNWFLRLFERPIPIYVKHAPIDTVYRAELNGIELGMLENFHDGVIFNLFATNNSSVEAQRFLATSREHSYTLSIYDDDHRVMCDYRGATGTMSHIKEPSYGIDMDLTHYKIVTFSWESMSNGHGRQMIRNPLAEARMELERSQLNLRRELGVNANLLQIAHEKMDYPFPLDAPASVPENSAPLPPTRDIKICKG
jgi:hypothetical protein